jgi:hypothetical protein
MGSYAIHVRAVAVEGQPTTTTAAFTLLVRGTVTLSEVLLSVRPLPTPHTLCHPPVQRRTSMQKWRIVR